MEWIKYLHAKTMTCARYELTGSLRKCPEGLHPQASLRGKSGILNGWRLAAVQELDEIYTPGFDEQLTASAARQPAILVCDLPTRGVDIGLSEHLRLAGIGKC